MGASYALSACSTLPISPFCPGDPIISDPNTPLTIDVHAHVFNGSDLQVEGFISYILALDNPAFKRFGPILQELGRDFAPTANDELAQLQQLGSALWACDDRASAQIIERFKDAGYRNAVIELKGALRRAQARRAFVVDPISAEIARQIQALPENRFDYKLSRRRLQQAPESIGVAGAIAFIIRNFQYRYVNVHDYLLEYSIGKERKVDLILAHLVDFDWGKRPAHPNSIRRASCGDGTHCTVDEWASALFCALRSLQRSCLQTRIEPHVFASTRAECNRKPRIHWSKTLSAYGLCSLQQRENIKHVLECAMATCGIASK